MFLAAASLAGCGSSSGTIPVTGKVTMDDQPVAGATVTFVPESDEGSAASAITDETGAYKLTTFEHGDGALPGSYKVKITKYQREEATLPEAGKEATPEDIDAIYAAMEEQGQDITGAPKKGDEPKNEIAAKFANPETSGFTAEVKAGGDNTFNFEVTSP